MKNDEIMKDYGVGHCPICGEFFSKLKKQHIYCTPKCAQRAADRRRYERAKAEREARRGVLNCVICGQVLRGKQTKYCCAECKGMGRYLDHPQLCTDEQTENAKRCECKRKNTCKYAANLSGIKYCDYIGITGHMRGGYPDECTHYEVRTERKPHKQAEWSGIKNAKRRKERNKDK